MGRDMDGSMAARTRHDDPAIGTLAVSQAAQTLSGGGAVEWPHQGIPRDANGDPIFWILPQDIRTRYDHRMAACEKAWTQTGDPAAVGEAETWAFTHRQPHPQWLHDAVVQLAISRRTKAHASRARADALHFMRYEAVRDAKYTFERNPDGQLQRRDRKNVSWEKAYGQATDILAETPAAGEPDTMRVSYIRVKGELKNGRHGLYRVMKPRP